MDHDDDVLYCYEIQLEECVRRKGLGVKKNINMTCKLFNKLIF